MTEVNKVIRKTFNELLNVSEQSGEDANGIKINGRVKLGVPFEFNLDKQFPLSTIMAVDTKSVLENFCNDFNMDQLHNGFGINWRAEEIFVDCSVYLDTLNIAYMHNFIFYYALYHHIKAETLDKVPRKLKFYIGECVLFENSYDLARDVLVRKFHAPIPQFALSQNIGEELELTPDDFDILSYEPYSGN